MAVSLNAGKGRGRYRPLAEINVTPLVDVMLVLLIIFMVAAPLMTVGVPVDLPKTQASALNQDNEPITITVNPEGKIFLQETEVPLEGLVEQLQAIARSQPAGAPERRIFVRGDKAISYGRVMEVMGTISAGGFSKVALLAEQPGGRPAAARPGAAPARGPAGTPVPVQPAPQRPQAPRG
ncbi:protein TolR [Paracraurococcus lichenis]|uniref:Protein TolR n=1 Tax=Paracraurococcus lichenis TaxID=3064888 RepID=A0ABT9DV66_9PROT|nr:protein TolR [Paracraurococcus sp. LOR1-02]MDO9707792.1 protein TolR [Paracraurococcus sp. LOR1-02]